MSQISDIALVAQVVAFGNKRAFDSLVKKYQSSIRRFFLHQTLGDKELSDDLAQETFIKAYTHLTTFKNLSNFSTWLFRIAYNVFYDYIRSRKEMLSMDDDDCELESQHQEAPSESYVKADINEALKQLKPNERTCVTLHLMNDLPVDEIVAITNLPEGTVKSHIARGKEKLATFLRNNGYDR